MRIDIPSSGGMHTGTEFVNETLTLTTTNLVSKFIDVNGPFWHESVAGMSTADGDKVTVVNPDGSNMYFYTTVMINQASAKKIRLRLKASGNISAPKSDGFSIQAELYSVIDGNFFVYASEKLQFPIGEFSDTQFVLEITPTNAAQYCSILILTRYQTGTLTVWDVELFQDGDEEKQSYGEWVSESVDLYELANEPITRTGLFLERMMFYYGDLANVDSQESVEHSIQTLSKFQNVVIHPTTESSSDRAKYVEQQLIASGKQVYGYANGGIPEEQYNYFAPPLTYHLYEMDSLHERGFHGIFFDGGGFGGLPIEHMNYLADYAKSMNPPFSVFVNGRPQHVINPEVDTSTFNNPDTAPTISAVVSAESTLSPGTYKVAYSRYNFNGETLITPTASVTISAGQGIQVNDIFGSESEPMLGVNLYVSEAADSDVLKRYNTGPYQGKQAIITSLPTGPSVPLSNTAYTHNPNGIASSLDPDNDLLLLESFFTRSDNEYSGFHDKSFANAFNEWKVGMELARSLGIRVVAMPYKLFDTAIDDYAVPDEAYRIALALGFYGITYVDPQTPIQSPWYDQPLPDYGSEIVSYMDLHDAGNSEYRAKTDAGVIWLRTTDEPISRHGGSFSTTVQVNYRKGNVSNVTANYSEAIWEASNDRLTWKEHSGRTFIPGNERYVRLKVILRN